MKNKLAQGFDPFGTVTPPEGLSNFGTVEGGGIARILNLFINVLIVAGGVYAVFNIILAGYAFLSAGDDPKKIEAAWAKIYQTLIGLAFIAGSFILAAIFSRLLYGNFTEILNPTIRGL